MTIQNIKDHVLNSVGKIHPLPQKVKLSINPIDYKDIENQSQFDFLETKSMLIRIDSGHYVHIYQSHEVSQGDIRTDKIENPFQSYSL